MELNNFVTSINDFNNKKVSAVAVEDAWYCLIHCRPQKRTERRTFQSVFSKHPIAKGFEVLRETSKQSIKPVITLCMKYSKQWWTKQTDTYLFPALAITLYLYSTPESKYAIQAENTTKLYNNLITSEGPDKFTKYIICSDGHTSLGTQNGLGKSGPYFKPLFSLWNSVVRPLSSDVHELLRNYLHEQLPNMENLNARVDDIIKFGKGVITEETLWLNTVNALDLPKPKDYNLWVEKRPKNVKYDKNIKHTVEHFKYHFRFPVIGCNWPVDTLVSGLQKMIRRSRLKDSLWIGAHLVSLGLFHIEADGMWLIPSGPQGKITNLFNRLLIICAEECVPNVSLFYTVAKEVEDARNVLKDLKKPSQSNCIWNGFI